MAFSTPVACGAGESRVGRYGQGREGGAFQSGAAGRVVPRVHNATTGAVLSRSVMELVLFK